MAAMLTTLETVKEQLGIPVDDTGLDNVIEQNIKVASAAIESYCRRQFAEQDYEHAFCPTNKKYLYLQQWPIREVQKVILGDTELSAADYKVEEGRLVKIEGTWDHETTVEYTAGYILPGDEDTEAEPPVVRNLPYDLEAAATYYAVISHNTLISAGLKSEQVDVLRIQYGDGSNVVGGNILPLPATVMTLVNPYRKMVV